MASIFDRFTLKSRMSREFLAEFLGVTALCVMGNGAVAQQVLMKTSNFLSINIAYGIAVMFGAYLALGVSGGHINPAVTLVMAVLGKLPWRKVPVYWLAQYLGGIFSGLIVYLVYYDAHNNFDNGYRQIGGDQGTAGIYATYPEKYLTITNGFFDQILGTAILIMFILAVTTEKNVGFRVKGFEPLLIGIMVMGIGASYGVNCGYAINPARDFGPRLFTAMAGWGFGVFSANNYWFWVPLIAPHIGAVIGGALYQLLLGSHFVHDPAQAVYVRELDEGVNSKPGSRAAFGRDDDIHVRKDLKVTTTTSTTKGGNNGNTSLRGAGEEWVDLPETTPVQIQHR